MKQISNKEYEKYQQYQIDKLHGRILTRMASASSAPVLIMILRRSASTCWRCFILWGGPDGFSKERMTVLQTDGVASAAVADLNKNGYPDLILAQHMSTRKKVRQESYVTVYWGGPDGYAENRKMQLPASCANSVTVGDYNGNGWLDIYATSYNNSRSRDLLSFLYKNDHGHFHVGDVQYLFNHSGSGCVSGDFNGDGYTDLAVACHKEYGNHCSHSFIFWGGPDGLSETRKTVLPTTGPHGMSTVDPGNILDRSDKEYYVSECERSLKSYRMEAENMGANPKTTAFLKECLADALIRLLEEKPFEKIMMSSRKGLGWSKRCVLESRSINIGFRIIGMREA